ncbi:MAG: hypothetical protein H0U96_03105 [Acidobacteria bacterium]|jgi:uncharacterized protein YlzI (FlbEa/FlbD family)|nr:hypothetical protein [Acidobacteriota bacterium]
MTKLDQIQKALKGIDQGKLQKLGDLYFSRKLKNVKKIKSKGSVVGEEKTRKGTPDTLITLNNGKYIFIEYTAQQTGRLRKLSNDLKSCFDEKKTGIPLSKVEKIILACSSDLQDKDKIKLIKKGEAKKCVVDFLELTDFSFELHKEEFRYLAQEYLGVELDTGQILSPIDFITDYQKNKFATPLGNK